MFKDAYICRKLLKHYWQNSQKSGDFWWEGGRGVREQGWEGYSEIFNGVGNGIMIKGYTDVCYSLYYVHTLCTLFSKIYPTILKCFLKIYTSWYLV